MKKIDRKQSYLNQRTGTNQPIKTQDSGVRRSECVSKRMDYEIET